MYKKNVHACTITYLIRLHVYIIVHVRSYVYHCMYVQNVLYKMLAKMISFYEIDGWYSNRNKY